MYYGRSCDICTLHRTGRRTVPTGHSSVSLPGPDIASDPASDLTLPPSPPGHLYSDIDVRSLPETLDTSPSACLSARTHLMHDGEAALHEHQRRRVLLGGRRHEPGDDGQVRVQHRVLQHDDAQPPQHLARVVFPQVQGSPAAQSTTSSC